LAGTERRSRVFRRICSQRSPQVIKQVSAGLLRSVSGITFAGTVETGFAAFVIVLRADLAQR
jgi:hypothetical protein